MQLKNKGYQVIMVALLTTLLAFITLSSAMAENGTSKPPPKDKLSPPMIGTIDQIDTRGIIIDDSYFKFSDEVTVPKLKNGDQVMYIINTDNEIVKIVSMDQLPKE